VAGNGVDEFSTGGMIYMQAGSSNSPDPLYSGGDIFFIPGANTTTGFNGSFIVADVDTNTVIKSGPAVQTIGFFNNPATTQKTLPAALLGTATLAQVITQLNALRTALINSTLMK
jgi:hypothetical protein